MQDLWIVAVSIPQETDLTACATSQACLTVYIKTLAGDTKLTIRSQNAVYMGEYIALRDA